MVSAMLEEAAGDIEVLDDIIQEHETLLQKYPQGEFAPTLMFQLAELYYERSQLLFQQEMAQYELELESLSPDEPQPDMPQLEMTKTIFYCNELLQNYSDVPYRDKVMYKLAVAYMDTGKPEQSKHYFEQLAQEFPDSPITLEAHFRIGEVLFDRREFEEAITHYKLLLNHWDNPYFDMALYKLGWSYYNLQQYSDAISTFLALIEDINLVERLDSQDLSLSKMDLRSESIHYIASSFTEYGGPELASEFLQPLQEKEYTAAILRKMAELYENRTFYQEAIDTYRVLLQFYPFATEAPDYFGSIVANYERANDIEAANNVREEIIKTFGPNSEWAAHHKQGELYESGLAVTRDNLYYLGTFYQSQAQASDSLELYQPAIEKYLEYITTFPRQDNTSEIHYFLAECYYDIAAFHKAAHAYHEVATRYPDSEYREKAAFNRIFSYEQLRETVDIPAADTLHLKPFLTPSDSLELVFSDSTDALMLMSCNDFVNSFPQSSWLDQVYMKFGELLNELEAYLPAVDVYAQVLDIESSSYRAAAGLNAGQSYYDGGYFAEAREWFAKISETFADSSTTQRARRMQASSQFKIAEQLSAENKATDAASVLLSIAGAPVDSSFQERALFEAATQYQKSDSLWDAVRTFERLPRQHPNSELADKSLYQAALLREQLGDWVLAAADYMQLVNDYPDSPLRQQALRNAALNYENAQEWLSAKHAYDRFVNTFPDQYDEVLECTFKAGEMANKAGQSREAQNYYETTVASYVQFQQDGHAVDNYFVAQAQFMLGELLFDEYKSIDLVPPLEQNLKRKINSFTDVVKAYSESIKYQIADWTTASTHRIGMCYEEFVRAFLESPVPDGLDEEKQAVYRQTLSERARPYKEKALETYEKNIQLAQQNSIENSWVVASRERAQVLRDELQLGQVSEVSSTQGS